MDNKSKQAFIQAQLDSLDQPIFEVGILQKAHKAGGAEMKEEFEKTSQRLGSFIAMREALEQELKALQDEPTA